MRVLLVLVFLFLLFGAACAPPMVVEGDGNGFAPGMPPGENNFELEEMRPPFWWLIGLTEGALVGFASTLALYALVKRLNKFVKRLNK